MVVPDGLELELSVQAWSEFLLRTMMDPGSNGSVILGLLDALPMQQGQFVGAAKVQSNSPLSNI